MIFVERGAAESYAASLGQRRGLRRPGQLRGARGVRAASQPSASATRFISGIIEAEFDPAFYRRRFCLGIVGSAHDHNGGICDQHGGFLCP